MHLIDQKCPLLYVVHFDGRQFTQVECYFDLLFMLSGFYLGNVDGFLKFLILTSAGWRSKNTAL